jgi:glyoxylase-like metal-dependent hydrolase (beta-lactamase superfamily II)
MRWFRQYYLGCLSHASYLVGDTESGRAVVVDPQRDVDQYVADGLRIERVIETHLDADFLSGHLELAEATGVAPATRCRTACRNRGPARRAAVQLGSRGQHAGIAAPRNDGARVTRR